MDRCSFCGEEIPFGIGKIYAKKEGTVFHFCSNKCEKNLIKLGRKPVETKWTNDYRKLKKTLMSAKTKKGATE